MSEQGRETWSEYQRLVLAELERHDKQLQSLLNQLQEQNIKLDRVKTLPDDLSKLKIRVEAVEKTDSIDEAVSKNKKWIVTTLVLLCGSILIPILKLIFFPGS